MSGFVLANNHTEQYLTDYRGKESTVVIPDGITHIHSKAFFKNKDIMEVVIPDSTRIIDEHAFKGCLNLTCVRLPGDCFIYPESFADCPNLICVTVGKTTDMEYLDWDCLHKIFGFDNIGPIGTINGFGFEGTEIADCRSFANCEWLKKLVIPNEVTTIGDTAFLYCCNLSSLVIPESVVKIGYGAFSGCTNLASVTIPDSVTRIGMAAFEDVPHIVYHGTATGAPWCALAMN